MRRVKRILSAALAALSAVASASDPDPVAALEGDLRAAILEKVDEANPIDPATGARKYVSFGFIADIHKCRRVPGDDAAKNPVTDYWYGSAGVLTEPEPSIRLLGSVAKDTGLDAVAWIRSGVAAGAGEIVLNSIDTDGVKGGFDLEMLDAVCNAVSVPVIASGGAGCIEDFITLFRTLPRVDAGLAASIFHFGEVKISDLKAEMQKNGIPARL